MQNELQKEIQFAVLWTIILDLLFWILSLFLLGFQLSVIFGLIIGSAGMLLNLLLLRRSILRAVHYGKTRDLKGYLLRCLVASAAIASGLMNHFIHAAAVVLPFLYPKIIFGILAFHMDKKTKQ